MTGPRSQTFFFAIFSEFWYRVPVRRTEKNRTLLILKGRNMDSDPQSHQEKKTALLSRPTVIPGVLFLVAIGIMAHGSQEGSLSMVLSLSLAGLALLFYAWFDRSRLRALRTLEGTNEALRKKNATLEKAEEKVRNIVSATPLGMFIYELKPDGRLIFSDANPAADAVLGVDCKQFIGKTIEEAFPPLAETEVPDRYRRAAEEGVFWHTEQIDYDFEQIKGAFDVYAFQTTPGVMAVMFTDITERKRTEAELARYRTDLEERVEERTSELKQAQEQLIASERLAALGRFAGSVAHEIRNPIAVISNSAYFLKRKVPGDDGKVVSHLDEISSQVHRTTEIIDSMLRLSRMEAPSKKRHDLVEIVRSSLERIQIPDNVSVTIEAPAEPLLAEADREQLTIAFKNMIKNAVQAMESGGTLTVSGREVEDNGTPLAEIRFIDSGPGIGPHDLKRIFEPLFTTKSFGIGFGLSIVRTIVERHGGTVYAASESGEGATLAVRLPRRKRKEM